MATRGTDFNTYTIQLTTVLAKLSDLISTQLFAGTGSPMLNALSNCREFQIQIDTETSPSGTIRLGDATTGQSLGTIPLTQKGWYGAGGGASDTFRSSVFNVRFGSMYGQAVTGTVNVNIMIMN